jgi:serine/threonine-protein kinase
VKLPERAEAAFRKALAVDPVNRFHDIGQFWDEIEGSVGVSTPRITAMQGFNHDSLPPPSDATPGQPSSLLTEVDATKRMGSPQAFPELTLGLPKPAPGAAKPAPVPKMAPPPTSKPGGRALDDMEDQGLNISLMDAPVPLVSAAGAPRSSPQAAPSVGAVRVARSANVRGMPSEAPTMDTVLTRMMPALRVIGIGAAIMIADVAYAMVNGEAFRIGPARALYIAGPLVGYGVVKLVLSLVG